MSRPIRVNRRRKRNPILPVLILLITAVLLSLLIAGVWQAFSANAAGGDTSSASMEQLSGTQAPTGRETDEQAQSSSSEASSLPDTSQADGASSEEDEADPAALSGAVPEGERVKSTYFDDAVFVGDSLTTGIELYAVMQNTTVLAEKGLNLDSIYTDEVIKQEDGTRITVMDALNQKQYKKVYVMMGGNEVRDVEKSVFLKRYQQLLEDIRALQPDAILYVQSILPVTVNNNYNMDNQRIDEYNEALLELCEEEGLPFVNVAECMKDENGALPTEASPADGMHFGPDYYQKWFDYLKTHTITG